MSYSISLKCQGYRNFNPSTHHLTLRDRQQVYVQQTVQRASVISSHSKGPVGKIRGPFSLQPWIHVQERQVAGAREMKGESTWWQDAGFGGKFHLQERSKIQDLGGRGESPIILDLGQLKSGRDLYEKKRRGPSLRAKSVTRWPSLLAEGRAEGACVVRPPPMSREATGRRFRNIPPHYHVVDRFTGWASGES